MIQVVPLHIATGTPRERDLGISSAGRAQILSATVMAIPNASLIDKSIALH